LLAIARNNAVIFSFVKEKFKKKPEWQKNQAVLPVTGATGALIERVCQKECVHSFQIES